MHRSLLTTAALLGLLTVAPQIVRAQPAPYAPIPPLQQEVVPPPPGTRYVWRPGHWHWNGVQYVWVRGQYVIRQVGWGEWVPGHWAMRPGGYVWVPAHWR